MRGNCFGNGVGLKQSVSGRFVLPFEPLEFRMELLLDQKWRFEDGKLFFFWLNSMVRLTKSFFGQRKTGKKAFRFTAGSLFV